MHGSESTDHAGLSEGHAGDRRCWYLAYGSNTHVARLARYLGDLGADPDDSSRLIEVQRAIYFAGDSKTWGAPVAFMSLQERAEWNAHCRAFRLSEVQLGRIFAGENGGGQLPPLAQLGMAPNSWRQVLVPWTGDQRRGKYNAVVRLPDVDGLPAYTFTTSRGLPLGLPSTPYLDAMRDGLRGQSDEVDVPAYLDRAMNPPAATNTVNLERITRPTWAGPVTRGGAAGFPVVRMPRDLAPVVGPRAYVGRIRVGTATAETWLDFSLPEDAKPCVAGAVSDVLGLPPDTADQAFVELEPMVQLERQSGLLSAIPRSDIAQVSQADVNMCGDWLLAISPHYSAPLRVQTLSSTPAGNIRLAYAARTLLAVQNEDLVVFQSMPKHSTRRLDTLAALPLRALERVLGAPPVALRATEGLVGDDGRKVARVDPTAFDFLGMAPGDVAVLTWGPRSTRIRLLSQTSETRQSMEEQLAERTGRQRRDSLANVESRAETPEHLRVWVSSTARSELGIPPDTLVRLRRDLLALCLRHTSAAAVPAAGLIIAAVAVPSVPYWVWILAALLVLALVAAPLHQS